METCPIQPGGELLGDSSCPAAVFPLDGDDSERRKTFSFHAPHRKRPDLLVIALHFTALADKGVVSDALQHYAALLRKMNRQAEADTLEARAFTIAASRSQSKGGDP